MRTDFFDEVVDRRGTNCAKWDAMDGKYNCKDMIHLGVADMDFRCSDAIREGIRKCAEHGIFGYTDVSDEFYLGIINWYKKRKGIDVKKEEIVFCPRINVALGLCVEEFSEKGDEILINTPSYPPLYNAVKKNGRTPIESPLVRRGDRFYFSFKEMQERISARTKAFVLCNPHNPVGRVWSREELCRIGELVTKRDLILFSDEIHGDIISPKRVFTSALGLPKEVRERTIAAASVTKTFNVAGSVLSYMIIPNKRIREAVKTQIDRVGMHNPNIFSMDVIRAAYYHSDEWYEAMLRYIEENARFTKEYFGKYMPEIEFTEREATYLMWGDYRKLGCSEEELYRWFVKKAKVGVYMGTEFGEAGRGYFRINIASPRALLWEAYERMRRSYADLLA